MKLAIKITRLMAIEIKLHQPTLNTLSYLLNQMNSHYTLEKIASKF